MTDDFSLIHVLADPYEIRQWNSDGLPRDTVRMFSLTLHMKSTVPTERNYQLPSSSDIYTLVKEFQLIFNADIMPWFPCLLFINVYVTSNCLLRMSILSIIKLHLKSMVNSAKIFELLVVSSYPYLWK